MKLPDSFYTEVRKKLEAAETIDDVMGTDGVIRQILQTTVSEFLQAEMTVHLGYDKHDPSGNNSGNNRNGSTRKRVATEHGPIEIVVPRDRNGSFEPVAVRKHERRLGKVEDIVISLYARGMSTRDIQAQIEDLYGVEISPSAVSQITESVMATMVEWQNRPLEALFPIVYFDAIHYRVRSKGRVVTKAAYSVLGITVDGQKELLGIWVGESEGATFWFSVLTELRNRGLEDILIVCIDGLKGFPEAIEDVFPHAAVQSCVIHQIRFSTKAVTWKDLKAVLKDLRQVYTAPTREAAEVGLDALEKTWGEHYPLLIKSWRENWPKLSTYLAYPKELRHVIYTTNAIESLYRQFRKVTKNKAAFPDDDALRKMLFLAQRHIAEKWTMRIPKWSIILGQLANIFEGRITILTNRD
jgi:transposase-like protein